MDEQQFIDYLYSYYHRLRDHRARTREHGPEELKRHCMSVYGNNTKSICWQPERSFMFEAGTDPLDWIYIFKNEYDPSENIPRHWHYIGCGLSDIYLYSHLHHVYDKLKERRPDLKAQIQSMRDWFPIDQWNGFGFELTIRVRCNSDEEWNSPPPNWPIRVMQDLASYVLLSKNIFQAGDHVAWETPLDGESSKIEHVLFALDSKLGTLNSTRGLISFIQIVGVCTEELLAARECSASIISKMLQEHDDTGGKLLITDMRRDKTLFEIDSGKHDRLCEVIKQKGSDMIRMSARHTASCRASELFSIIERRKHATGMMVNNLDTSYKSIVVGNAPRDEPTDYLPRTMSRMSISSEFELDHQNLNLKDRIYYDDMYILLSKKSARVLPVMLNGRLAHRKKFTFQSFNGRSTITFVPQGCPSESMASREHPFVKIGPWLEIYVPTTLCEQMHESIKEDFDPRSSRPVDLPKNYSWPHFNLHLTVVENDLSD